MDEHVVSVDELELSDHPRLLSTPGLAQPYQCAKAVTLFGCLPRAEVHVEVDGFVMVDEPVGFPESGGVTLPLPVELTVGQMIRVRQRHDGRTSDWSHPVQTREHLADYPAGLPRPVIHPEPVYECGVRTGVTNLLGGGNVWITADGVEVGRADGCGAPKQGVNVSPAYTSDQRVRAHYELCDDQSPPSAALVVKPPPAALPAPVVGPLYSGGERLAISGVTNGALVTLTRDGSPVASSGCWGGTLFVTLSPPVTAGEVFSAEQQLCAGSPPSPSGTTEVQPCSELPAPRIGPIQAGDRAVTIAEAAPGAQIRVYVNGVQAGLGSGSAIGLDRAVVAGDLVAVVQSLPPTCPGRLARLTTVACVDPPYTYDPSALNLFPVGSDDYEFPAGTSGNPGRVRGSVRYPADDDGPEQPFNSRLAATGRCPIVFLLHGYYDFLTPSHLGYDYVQESLARMGFIAVSVDSSDLNLGGSSGVEDIEDRADLVIDSILYFQGLMVDPGSRFFQRIDFGRVGLMGHSRGGDAVITLPTVLPLAGVTIRAVLALAPTNYRSYADLPTIAPDGYAFMTILPAADGDVVNNNGAQFYDAARPGPFKSQLYVHNMNHNRFNRRWPDDDPVIVDPVATREEHERVLEVYGSAFFRSALLGHDTGAFLDGRQRPPGVRSDLVHPSFARQGAITVDDHKEGNAVTLNSLGQPTAQWGGMTADEYSFGHTPNAYNHTFFGHGLGMVMEPHEIDATFRSSLDSMDLRGCEIWVRVAEVMRGYLPPEPAGFQLGLEDADRLTAWVDSDSVGGVPRPHFRSDVPKTMLTTLRFRSDCFRTAEPRLLLHKIRGILFRCDRHQLPPLAVDDLQIVRISEPSEESST
ncbi:hypothetical protein ACIBFB_20385 [Nocardiopsis sp. NPDC050513]|uniref:hypothetical protein n=1 Tax=Nocardiopsis sp. NPDC050513 TaxID=3364338 RepID=UPI0037B84C55